MALPKKAAGRQEEISVLEVARRQLSVCILGTTPLICNRVSEKAKRELLMPRGTLSRADKKTNLKHDPLREYRDSPYTVAGEEHPTRIVMPATAFKGALRDVALDMPGAAKSQIGRLTYVIGDQGTDYVSIYGVPQLLMSIVRSADISRTPDVRSRAIIPQWACRLTVSYVFPLLRDPVVANLLAAAGIMRGVGDWRPEKGAGDYGQFSLVDADNPSFLAVVMNGGRAAQDVALADPQCYDTSTTDLLGWYVGEIDRRGITEVAS